MTCNQNTWTNSYLSKQGRETAMVETSCERKLQIIHLQHLWIPNFVEITEQRVQGTKELIQCGYSAEICASAVSPLRVDMDIIKQTGRGIPKSFDIHS